MKTLLISFFLFLSFQMAAQAPVVNDKKADKLLAMISKRYKNFKTIKADFTHSLESKGEKMIEKQKGGLYVKGNKFKLDIAGQTITCDNATVWTYSKEANEVQISNYKPKENAIRLDDIFTMYGKGFLYKIAEERKENGHDIVVVELTPKDKKKSFFKIRLTIDKTNQSIVKSVVYEKTGSIHTYVITNQVPNLRLDDHFFSFDAKKHPGVEIIDLR